MFENKKSSRCLNMEENQVQRTEKPLDNHCQYVKCKEKKQGSGEKHHSEIDHFTRIFIRPPEEMLKLIVPNVKRIDTNAPVIHLCVMEGCIKRFDSKKLATKHMANDHNMTYPDPDLPVECSACEAVIGEPVKEHVLKHKNGIEENFCKNSMCFYEGCEKVLRNCASWYYHFNTFHQNLCMYVLCKNRGPTKVGESILAHERSHHKFIRMYMYKSCGKHCSSQTLNRDGIVIEEVTN